MRWLTRDPLCDLYGRPWEPALPQYFSALWLMVQWDWRREPPPRELYPR